MRAMNLAVMFATITGLAATAPISCKDNGQGSGGGGGAGGSGGVVEPTLPYHEEPPYTLPSGLTQLGAIAVDSKSAMLYVASGSALLRADAKASGALSPWKDLAAEGVGSIASLRVLDGGDLAVAASDDVVRVSPAGEVVSHARFKVAFGGGFGGPSIAVAPDGKQAYVVEGGAGSAGNSGSTVVHVARIDLVAAAMAPTPVDPAEVWELTEPFHVVPPEVGFINAAAPVVSSDGKTLYVTHVVLRTAYAVGVAAPHGVTAVNTDSLQRSALVQSLDDGVLTQVATFDQTVPVFRVNDDLSATFLAEIPVGQSPQGVASFDGRVFVTMAPGFGGGPPVLGDGGVPGFGDGGLPGPGGAGAGSTALLVFTLEKGGK
jgi:hypothetical protein